MADMFSKTKMVNVVTPEGGAMWAKVIEPDYKFDKDGRYECTLVVDPEDKNEKTAAATQKFIDMVEDMLEKAYQTASEEVAPGKAKTLTKTPAIKEHLDKDGNETGLWAVKAKSKAKFKDEDITIPIYDVKAARIDNPGLIGNGSRIKLQVGLKPYYMASNNSVGISMRLKRVQIIDLNPYSGGSGFADESDGAEYDDAPFKDDNNGGDF
jgi:hypothetical protein